MDTKLPYSKFGATALTPKARLGGVRKPAQIRAFMPVPLGQRCPGHCPAQPGAFVREQGPFPGMPKPMIALSGGALGRPIDITQVADLIGCSPWTVRQTLIPRGLPFFRFKASGRLVFYEAQVIRWIESQQQGGKTTK